MKKIVCFLFALLLLFALPIAALAEEAPPAELPEASTAEPFTWSYLATIAGAAAFTLLFVQLFKVPLDKVWKIPTRAFAYIVSLACPQWWIRAGSARRTGDCRVYRRRPAGIR